MEGGWWWWWLRGIQGIICEKRRLRYTGFGGEAMYDFRKHDVNLGLSIFFYIRINYSLTTPITGDYIIMELLLFMPPAPWPFREHGEFLHEVFKGDSPVL